MRSLIVLVLLIASAGTAAAQSKPAPRPAIPPSTTNAVGARTQLQALHYKDIEGLRRDPSGYWVGKATQNGVEKQVMVGPGGVVTAR
jgi:hypothetical protein